MWVWESLMSCMFHMVIAEESRAVCCKMEIEIRSIFSRTKFISPYTYSYVLYICCMMGIVKSFSGTQHSYYLCQAYSFKSERLGKEISVFNCLKIVFIFKRRVSYHPVIVMHPDSPGEHLLQAKMAKYVFDESPGNIGRKWKGWNEKQNNIVYGWICYIQ